MNTAEILVKMLEEDGVKHIFGHPGEQILPVMLMHALQANMGYAFQLQVQGP